MPNGFAKGGATIGPVIGDSNGPGPVRGSGGSPEEPGNMWGPIGFGRFGGIG
jgi:hypothetical protein